jgi:hypothetical protein
MHQIKRATRNNSLSLVLTLTGFEPSPISLGITATSNPGDAKSDVGQPSDTLTTLLAFWQHLSETERARFLAAIGR